jgi:hypothetical protein
VTPMELALECKRVIESEHGLTKVCLVVAGPPPRGERIRLDRTSRKKCPMGEPANWTERGTVAYFDAVEVLAWLAARGLVQVEVQEAEQ